MKNLSLTLDHAISVQKSPQGGKLSRIANSISAFEFIKLFLYAENEVNPRTAKTGTITNAIMDTLNNKPTHFWQDGRGLVVATEKCEFGEKNNIKISLENIAFEGIMDGGTTSTAISMFIANKLFDIKLTSWRECKSFWKRNYNEIVEKFNEMSKTNKDVFNFSVQFELFFPNGQAGSDIEFRKDIAEVCAARNSSSTLKDSAKANQIGSYGYLQERLEEFDIIWKQGEEGTIPCEDVINFSNLSLYYLQQIKKLPSGINKLSKPTFYSGKGNSVKFYNKLLSHEEISAKLDNGKIILTDDLVESALDLSKDILSFADRLSIDFEKIYNKNKPENKKLSELKQVKPEQLKKVRFGTTDKIHINYPIGYITPLICGLTKLMEFNEKHNKIQWKINPKDIKLNLLNLKQYTSIMKDVNYDSQTMGKTKSLFNEAENVFDKYLENNTIL